ncbi:MAG: mobile mystery protein B [Gammaproteobacteria bacterium]|nr:mobile mystery protein B [Gammaproteobacteria bacterium]
MKFEYAPGATPIDPDEAAGLIPAHLTLQRELNEYEEANILEATEWLFTRRRGDPLDERFIHTVHRRMFDQTWNWAGQARRSDKNIGVTWSDIPVQLRQMLGDVRAQIEHRAYRPSEIAARYHHRLVSIHVFPNGNGRHARVMADLLLADLADQRFEWGRGSLQATSDLRTSYITALQAADNGDVRPLLVSWKLSERASYKAPIPLSADSMTSAFFFSAAAPCSAIASACANSG